MKSYKYICGNAFKHQCKYSVGKFKDARIHDFSFSVNNNDNNKVFIKTEYVGNFFHYINLDFEFEIVTHNSDIPVDSRFINFLENEKVTKWYGQNINIAHPKVESIPIGLANPKWAHGNQKTLEEVASRNIKKEQILYVNFDVSTNYIERSKCLEETGLELSKKIRYEEYLEEIAKSYFIISPNGNGIDCHKHWEAFYLNTVPIVTDSINIQMHNELPFLILNEWKDFKSLDLTEELYNKTMSSFNREDLLFENYIKLNNFLK